MAVEFVSVLEDCSDESDLRDVCEEFSRGIGFEYYMLAVCTPTSLSSPKISTLTNYPDSWMSNYFQQNMQKDDPVVRYCFENTAPIRWDDLMHMEQYITAKGVEVIQLAGKAGLAAGFSIPIKAPNGQIVIFSMATKSADDLDSRVLKALADSQVFSVFLLNNYNRIHSEQTEKSKSETLTPREIECLFWACEGKTTWEISKILGITERTVVFHLSCSTKKLEATNRQHAVAKAIASGLITPVV